VVDEHGTLVGVDAIRTCSAADAGGRNGSRNFPAPSTVCRPT